MKNKNFWLITMFAFLFIGATTVCAQQKKPPTKPKTAPIVRSPLPAPPTTRSPDIISTDFEDKKSPDSAKLKTETADNRETRKYVRRCRKYVSKQTGKTYRRCRNVKVS